MVGIDPGVGDREPEIVPSVVQPHAPSASMSAPSTPPNAPCGPRFRSPHCRVCRGSPGSFGNPAVTPSASGSRGWIELDPRDRRIARDRGRGGGRRERIARLEQPHAAGIEVERIRAEIRTGPRAALERRALRATRAVGERAHDLQSERCGEAGDVRPRGRGLERRRCPRTRRDPHDELARRWRGEGVFRERTEREGDQEDEDGAHDVPERGGDRGGRRGDRKAS